MLVLMLDPHFKNLHLIKYYVGLEFVLQVAVKYNHKVFFSNVIDCLQNYNAKFC
jgi:hypothetical protein